jgi:hypothetical protein
MGYSNLDFAVLRPLLRLVNDVKDAVFSLFY